MSYVGSPNCRFHDLRVRVVLRCDHVGDIVKWLNFSKKKKTSTLLLGIVQFNQVMKLSKLII